MSDWIGPAIAAVATLVTGWFAFRGSRRTDKTDSLSRAAGLYSDYADKQEERAEKLEAGMEEMRRTHRESEERQRETNERMNARLNDLEDENAQYKTLLSEVVRWITELLDWETRGYPDPPPRMTLAMVLAHLTNALDQSARSKSTRAPSEPSRRGGTRRAHR